MIEQSRHARSAFARGWGGIAAVFWLDIVAKCSSLEGQSLGFVGERSGTGERRETEGGVERIELPFEE